MLLKFAQRILVLLLAWSLIYTPVLAQDRLALPASDFEAPKIEHTPDNDLFKTGTVKPIIATVTDDTAVKSVVLYYRTIGTERFSQANFARVGKTDEYRVELDEEYYSPPGIEYYIQAIDSAGNGLLVGSSFSPMKLAIEDGGAASPVGQGETSSDTQTAVLNLDADKKEEGSNYKWLWIGLGVLAVGALAGGGGGGGGDDPEPAKTGTVIISGNTP